MLPEPAPRRIAGVVLAGGKARRFGGDKASALYRGRPLIDWSVAALEPHVERIFVSGHAHPVHPSVADRPQRGLGPLGGLAGALHAAREAGCSHLLSLPCDTPHVPDALLANLCRSKGAACAAACPVIGCWPVGLGEALEQHLASGGRRAVHAWVEIIDAAAVEGFEMVVNINSTADLDKLERRDS